MIFTIQALGPPELAGSSLQRDDPRPAGIRPLGPPPEVRQRALSNLVDRLGMVRRGATGMSGSLLVSTASTRSTRQAGSFGAFGTHRIHRARPRPDHPRRRATSPPRHDRGPDDEASRQVATARPCYAHLAAGLGHQHDHGVRYIHEALEALATLAPSIHDAVTVVKRKAFVILDGTRSRMDRVGMGQVVAAPSTPGTRGPLRKRPGHRPRARRMV